MQGPLSTNFGRIFWMNWYRNLYFGKNAEKKKDRFAREIDAQIYRGNTWLITLAANPANQLELFSVHQLRFPYIRRSCPMILGIASGYEEALEVFLRIVQDVLEATGGVDIRGYFQRREQI